MNRVVIYTKKWCGYCRRATGVFTRKGVPYDEIDVTFDHQREEEMIRLSGRWTVPQVFIDGRSIGGSTEVVALDADGRLDAMLAAPPEERPESSEAGG